MVLIYANKAKDNNGKYLAKLSSLLQLHNVEYKIVNDEDLSTKINAEAIFVLGGDGTVLFVSEFANRNNVPIIGINAGCLGFLSEFECNDIDEAVDLFLSKDFIVEKKLTISITVNGKIYLAVNDVFAQRYYSAPSNSLISKVSVKIDDNLVNTFKGDGVIISTPTGTTGYTLSAGGAIVGPNVDAISITPICAHSLNQRSILCAANSVVDVIICENSCIDLFIDGRFITKLSSNDSFSITKAEKPTLFLRKTNYDFYNRLQNKFCNGECNE